MGNEELKNKPFCSDHSRVSDAIEKLEKNREGEDKIINKLFDQLRDKVSWKVFTFTLLSVLTVTGWVAIQQYSINDKLGAVLNKTSLTQKDHFYLKEKVDAHIENDKKHK